MELCCDEKQCSNDQEGNKSSNDNSSCMPCCSIQNCQCNFINIPQFNFLIQMHLTAKKFPAKNDKVPSDYLSDCWHPPKIV